MLRQSVSQSQAPVSFTFCFIIVVVMDWSFSSLAPCGRLMSPHVKSIISEYVYSLLCEMSSNCFGQFVC